MLRHVWNLAPLVLVLLAWGLSAGVVAVMETPRQDPEPRPMQAAVAPAAPAPAPARPKPLSAPDMRPELSALLSASILDREVQGPPEENRNAAGRPKLPPLTAYIERTPRNAEEGLEDDFPESVPEPASSLLLVSALMLVLSTGRLSSPRAARRRR